MDFPQLDKAIFGVNSQLETSADTVFGQEWPQAHGWESQASTAFGDHLDMAGSSLIVAEYLLLIELQTKVELLLTGCAHRLAGKPWWRLLCGKG
jgi:hypothetical protein